MRTKLTPAFCQRATVQQGAERTIYWDTDLPGFGLLVTKNGHRSFVVQYRSGATRSSRRMKIAGVLGLIGARKQARKLLGQVASDKDPLHERREQQRKAIARTEHTFEKIAENYLARGGRVAHGGPDPRPAHAARLSRAWLGSDRRHPAQRHREPAGQDRGRERAGHGGQDAGDRAANHELARKPLG